jgi:hypothetical protein
MSQIEGEWPASDLRVLELAEVLCPFGERAQTLRALYLAQAFAASQGSKEAAETATEVFRKLLPDG